MSQSWNPEERLAQGIARVRTMTPSQSNEKVLFEIDSRSQRRAAKRALHLIVGVSTAAITSIGIGLTVLIPGHARPLDMDSFQAVLANTSASPNYYQRRYASVNDGVTASEATTEIWKLSSVTVYRSRERHASPYLEPNDTIGNKPFREMYLWMQDNGEAISYEPMFHYAVKYRRGYPLGDTPASTAVTLAQGGKLVEATRDVPAHGGRFDRFVFDLGEGIDGTRQTVYADSKSHLIRFVDVNRIDRPEVSEATTEYRYDVSDRLALGMPALPKNVPVVSPKDIRQNFEREIKKPLSTQTVNGIKVTFYGVVVRSPGDIRVILSGGAPRDPRDPHQMVVIGAPSYPFAPQPRLIGSHLTPYTGNAQDGGRQLLGPLLIDKKPYIVESSNRFLLGKVPGWLTLFVPIWKYDKSHPFKGAEETVYRSKFVGYATIRTNKIFEMPEVAAEGAALAELPSQYVETK